MKAVRICAIPILFLIFLSGCFSYVPTEIETVPEGARVTATLTEEGRQELYRRTGIERETINGKLVERRGNSVVFSVRSVLGSDNLTGSDLVQHVDVLREHVGRIDLKEIDGPKTTLLIAGGSAAVAVVSYLAMTGDPVSSGGDGSGGGSESIQFPFLVLRFVLPH